MEKLYVNAIGPDGDVSTVGLFYSQRKRKRSSHSCAPTRSEPVIAMKLSKRCAMFCLEKGFSINHRRCN